MADKEEPEESRSAPSPHRLTRRRAGRVDRTDPSALSADLWRTAGPRRAASARPALRPQAGGPPDGQRRPGRGPCPPALAHRQADTAPAPDLVNRNFDPARADQVWAADVTQFWTE